MLNGDVPVGNLPNRHLPIAERFPRAPCLVICWPLLGVWARGNWIFLAVGLLGVQLAVLGVLGESIGRIYDETRDRPVYVVRQAVGFDVDEEEAGPRMHLGPREVVASEPSRIRFFT